jgi:hypothetical protein
MPARRASWLRRLAIAAVVAVALLAGIVALVPLFVDGDRVRQAVERRISALAGGEVRYDSLKLRFFPRPYVEAHNATVRIPGTLDGRIGTLAIRIAALPLLTGDVRPVSVDIAQPVLEVTIPAGSGGAGGDPLAAYRAALGPVVDALVQNAAGMSLGITDGKLDVRYAGERVLSLSGLAADAEVATDAIAAKARGNADLFGAASATLRIVPGSLAATGTLQAFGLRLPAVLQMAGAQGETQVTEGALDAALNAETDGRESARATLTVNSPQLTLARGARTLALGSVRTTLDASRDGAGLAVSLRALQLGELVPAATGTLRAKPDGTAPSVEVQVPALDLGRLRAALIAIAGDLDAMQTALAFVPTGTAQGLTAGAAGADFGALAALGAIRAETALAGGALDLRAQGIRVTGATGRFALADGTLRGSELAGAIGSKSTFTGGALVVELAPETAFRELDTALDADLAEALPIVRRLAGEPAALAGVESLAGRASGSVAYDARHKRPRVTVDLERIRATARYRGVPLPIAVSAGALRYAHDRLTVHGLNGSFGRSTLQAGAMELSLGTEPAVREASAEATVVLDEFYPWLTSLHGLRRPADHIPSATGTVTVRLERLSGPLDAPGALDYEAVIRPQLVQLAGPALPAPATLAGGEARITPRSIALDRLDASMLDARVVASGTVQDYASGEPRFDLALADARAGERSIEWAHARWKLPAQTIPRAPVTLAAGRVQRAGGADAPIHAQGTLGLAGGVSAEVDLTTEPGGHFDLRRLAVKDPDTDTTLLLKWKHPIAEVDFKGKLDNRTLARVLAHPPAGEGALKGDFRATIDLAEPRRSNATGALEADRIDILERWGVPVGIERLRIDVAGDAVRIHEGAIVVAGERLAVTGLATRQPKTFGLDLRVTADAIDVERLLRAFPRRDPKPAAAGWNLPVEGRVALDAKSVAYGRFVVRPLLGTATLAPDRIVADVKQAQLCGLALPLHAVLVPGNVSVTGKIVARAQPLAGTATCLLGEQIALTGTLDFDAELSASGPADALARTARGTFQLTARDGQILKAPALARVLTLGVVAGALRDRPSDLMARGLDYSELAVAGSLDAGRVRMASGTLNAAALGFAWSGEVDVPAGQLDVHGIVAPFSRVQGVLQHVPVVGQIFGARVVGIPVSITGDMGDPRVVPLGPAAIGQSLVNLMGAVVKTPVDLLDPFLGRVQRAP